MGAFRSPRVTPAFSEGLSGDLEHRRTLIRNFDPAPLHMHSREDEFTVVTAGRIGFLLGDEVFTRAPGNWSASPGTNGIRSGTPEMTQRECSRLSPAGLERYFEEIGPFFPDGAEPDLAGMARANDKYGLQMDFDSLPGLIERFGLARPAEMDGTAPA